MRNVNGQRDVINNGIYPLRIGFRRIGYMSQNFRSGIDGLKIYIDGRLIETEKRLDVLDRKIEINATKIDMLQHFQTIGFTVMGAVIGFAVLILGVAPAILDVFRDKRQEKREEDIRGIVREEIARLKGLA